MEEVKHLDYDNMGKISLCSASPWGTMRAKSPLRASETWMGVLRHWQQERNDHVGKAEP